MIAPALEDARRARLDRLVAAEKRWAELAEQDFPEEQSLAATKELNAAKAALQPGDMAGTTPEEPPDGVDLPTLRDRAEPGCDDVGPEERIGYTEIQQAAHARFAPKLAPKFEFQDAAELLEEPDTNPLWLIDGLLPEAGVCVIAGEPKATKTWVGFEFGCALATASPAFGEFKAHTRRHVAMFLAEDSKRSVKTRLRVLTKMRGLDGGALRDWMRVICRGQLNLLEHSETEAIVAACRAMPDLGLLVLDPLRDLHNGEENDSTAMAAVMRELRWMRDQLRCAVLFIHHSSKASKDTESRRPGQRMRGSSAIHGAVDAGIYMSDTKTDLQSYWQNKVSVEIKEGAGAGIFNLTLHLDNVDGVAQAGSWELGSGDSKQDEAAREAVVTVLQKASKPMGVGKLRRAMPKGLGSDRIVSRVLDDLRDDGIASHLEGDEVGWILTSKLNPSLPIPDPSPGRLGDTHPYPSLGPLGPGMGGRDGSPGDAVQAPILQGQGWVEGRKANGTKLTPEQRAALVAQMPTPEAQAKEEAEALVRVRAAQEAEDAEESRPEREEDRYP